MLKALFTAMLVTSSIAISVHAAAPQEPTAPTAMTSAQPPAPPCAQPGVVQLLYAHNAASGTLTPLAGRAGSYRLSLSGVAPLITYFSDRPARLAGHVSIEEFIERIGFGRKTPPNAVIEISEGSKGADVAVVELFNPAYDKPRGSLAFDVRVLNTPRKALAAWTVRADKSLPASFGAVSLFIDDASCISEGSDGCNASMPCCPGLTCQQISFWDPTTWTTKSVSLCHP